MPFHSLPAEIICKIVDSSPQTDTVGLLRSCRRIHSILEPVFYRTIGQATFRYMLADDILGVWTRDPLHLLLRTLLGRPELGQHVRYYRSWRVCYFSRRLRYVWRHMPDSIYGMKDDTFRTYSPEEMEQLRRRCHALSISEGDLAFWDIYPNDNLCAMNKLILSFCTRLRQLHAAADFTTIPVPRDMLLPALPMVLNYSDMSLLTEVHIVPERYANMSFPVREFVSDDSYCEGRLEWNSKIVASIFCLPMIRSIRISVYPGQDRVTWPKIRATTVRQLSLTLSSLYEESLAYMLASVPNVQALTLDLTWGRKNPSSYGQATGIMDLTKVGSALTRALSASPGGLEFLSISVQELAYSPDTLSRIGEDDRHAMEQAHMRQFNGCIGSLKEFTGLKTLSTNPGFQFGARLEDTAPLKDMIPDSLTKLVLTTYFELRNPLNCLWGQRDLRDYFQQYLEDGYTGKLTDVVLNLQEDFSTARTEDKIGRNVDAEWQELNDICEQRGITLGWNSYPFRRLVSHFAAPSSWLASDPVDDGVENLVTVVATYA